LVFVLIFLFLFLFPFLFLLSFVLQFFLDMDIYSFIGKVAIRRKRVLLIFRAKEITPEVDKPKSLFLKLGIEKKTSLSDLSTWRNPICNYEKKKKEKEKGKIVS